MIWSSFRALQVHLAFVAEQTSWHVLRCRLVVSIRTERTLASANCMQAWFDKLSCGGRAFYFAIAGSPASCAHHDQFTLSLESSKLGGVVDHFSKVYALPPARDALLLHAR